MQTTFQVDLDNEREVENLRQLLDLRLKQLRNERSDSQNGEGGIEGSVNRANAKLGNIEILKQFASEASPNQHKVLKWMKEHPGEVSAHVLEA